MGWVGSFGWLSNARKVPLSYNEAIEEYFGSGLIDYLYLDDPSGTTALDYSGNGLNGTYANVTGLQLAQSLPPFTAPILGATSYVNLNAASIASRFSYLTGSYHYWFYAPLALWDDSTARRLAMLQVDTSNRIDCQKLANADTLQFDYKALTASNTKNISNLTMTSGWIPIGLRWNKAGDAVDIFINGHKMDTISSLGNLAGTVTNTTIGVSPSLPAGSLAKWSLGSTLLEDGQFSQLAAKVARDKLITFDGDSLTLGGQGGAVPYPKQMMRLYYGDSPLPNCVGYNLGGSSETVATMITTAPTTVDIYRADAGFSKYICVFMGGTNDIDGAVDAATVQSRIQTYCLARRAAGLQVVVCTIIPNGHMAAGEKTVRGTVNTWLLANYASFADAIADPTANAAFDQETDVSDGTYYNVDTIHLTTAGYGLLASIIKPVVDAL